MNKENIYNIDIDKMMLENKPVIVVETPHEEKTAQIIVKFKKIVEEK